MSDIKSGKDFNFSYDVIQKSESVSETKTDWHQFRLLLNYIPQHGPDFEFTHKETAAELQFPDHSAKCAGLPFVCIRRASVPLIPLSGMLVATVSWKTPTGALCTESIEVPLNDTSSAQSGPPQSDATILQEDVSPPQLIEILKTPWPGWDAEVADQSEAVLDILSDIQGALTPEVSPWFEDSKYSRWTQCDLLRLPSWRPDPKNDSPILPYRHIDPDNLTEPWMLEECWAETVTEMLLGIPYFGPGFAYGLKNPSDPKPLYRAMISDTPCYPIVGACEHLVTMGLITRGLNELANYPVNSHQPASRLKDYLGGDVFDDDQSRTGLDATKKNPRVGPGAVYAFNANGADKPEPHVAFVLRATRGGALQFFDTGAMNHPAAGSINTGLKNVSTIFDYPGGAGRIQGPGSPYKGVWIPEPNMSRLRSGIKRAWVTRPLGFVRIMILKREAKPKSSDEAEAKSSAATYEGFLFASPLIPMWWPRSDTHGRAYPIPISLCLSAMRRHRHAKSYAVRLLFDCPRETGPLYRQMLENCDYRTYDFSGLPSTPESFLGQNSIHLHPIADFESNADGVPSGICRINKGDTSALWSKNVPRDGKYAGIPWRRDSHSPSELNMLRLMSTVTRDSFPAIPCYGDDGWLAGAPPKA